MAKRRPEAIPFASAHAVWAHYGLRHPEDLVLEDLAMAMDVLVKDGPLDSCVARLTRTGDTGVIRVKDGLAPTGRRRFAISHELGHWRLHRQHSQVFACTAQDLVARYKESKIEAEANSFASALLMPENLFRERQTDERPSFQQVESLADDFSVSLTAAAIRWMEIADDYAAAVVSQNGKVRWWRGTTEFEEALWITPGSKLSSLTLASKVSSMDPRVYGPEEVDLAAWTDGSDDLTSDVLIEESLSLGQYGQTLSLIWLA